MLLSRLYSIGSLAFRPTQDLAPSRRLMPGLLEPRRPGPVLWAPRRHIFGMNVPENQYDNNQLPKKMQMSYALIHHWEIIPLFMCVVFSFVIIFYGTVYTGFTQKVEAQFSRHNWNCISRNMDLRHPTIHKHFVYHQRYEPWPEMQDALDKMTKAEHRLQSRMNSCPSE